MSDCVEEIKVFLHNFVEVDPTQISKSFGSMIDAYGMVVKVCNRLMVILETSRKAYLDHQKRIIKETWHVFNANPLGLELIRMGYTEESAELGEKIEDRRRQIAGSTQNVLVLIEEYREIQRLWDDSLIVQQKLIACMWSITDQQLPGQELPPGSYGEQGASPSSDLPEALD